MHSRCDWQSLTLLILIRKFVHTCYNKFRVADKSKKLNTNCLLGLVSVVALVISFLILKLGYTSSNVTDHMTKHDFFVGSLQFMSTFTSVVSLKYVSFPFMVLAKSAKIMPVIIFGMIRGVYKFSPLSIGLSLMITSGLILFSSNKVRERE